MVKKTLRKTELFLSYKHLPENISTVGYYFVRKSLEAVPVPSSLEAAHSTLPQCFEVGTITSTPLNSLEKLLNHIFIPTLMLTGQKSSPQNCILNQVTYI